MSAASTALAKVDTGAYPVLAGDATEAIAALRENMGGSTISPFDLDVITIPGSGGLSWRVPGLAGETEEKRLEGILIFHRTNRAFWRESFDETGGGTPPDCASDDGILGQGDPGGDCSRCPMNQWGSAQKGRGKACQERHMLFLLRVGEHLPILVNCPPSSLGNVRKYMMRLTSKGVPYYTVATALSLERDKNADGISYSRIVAEPIGAVDPSALQQLAAYREAIIPALQRVRLEPEDYEADA